MPLAFWECIGGGTKQIKNSHLQANKNGGTMVTPIVDKNVRF